jgi:hypothetical protein
VGSGHSLGADGAFRREGRVELAADVGMKADAMRPQDADDVRLLAGAMGSTTAEEVAAVHDRLLPEQPLSAGKLRRIREALATPQ